MGSEAGGVDLCEGERSDGDGYEDSHEFAQREVAQTRCRRNRLGKDEVGENGHGCTSVLG